MNEQLEAARDPGGTTETTVMIVDDDDGVRHALRLWLEMEYRVVCYAGARQALSALREGVRPDLIILDLMMPEMNGWQFRVLQRESPDWAAIPVIVLSADETAQAAAIDADAHLRKPVDGDLLVRTCREVLDENARRRAELMRVGELQRLVSLGALLGGISHEINNPLAFVYGSIDILRRQLVTTLQPNQVLEPLATATAMRALERAREGADRIAAVVRSAAMFATSDFEGTEAIDVHEVLESALQVASNEIRHGAHLVRAYRDIPLVRGNAARLGQVFLNLILNALDGIRETGGRDHVIRVGTYAGDERVVVTVTDSASAREPIRSEVMWDPALAAFGRGPRLRFPLTASREFVEDMGGSLEATSSEADGAGYRVVLPSAGRSSLPAPAPKPPVRIGDQRAKVLVIDDEPLLCEILRALLEEQFDVTAFSSPRAALQALKEHDYAAVLCDVMMPELNGTELFEEAVRERAELATRFVFLTGGAFTERARLLLKKSGCPVLKKPCERRELLNVLRQVTAAT